MTPFVQGLLFGIAFGGLLGALVAGEVFFFFLDRAARRHRP